MPSETEGALIDVGVGQALPFEQLTELRRDDILETGICRKQKKGALTRLVCRLFELSEEIGHRLLQALSDVPSVGRAFRRRTIRHGHHGKDGVRGHSHRGSVGQPWAGG